LLAQAQVPGLLVRQMAITKLPATADIAAQEILAAARAAGLVDQALQEVVECWDVIQTWRGWIEGRYGPLNTVRHRSSGDDPPDLELVFPSTCSDGAYVAPPFSTWLGGRLKREDIRRCL
jgi:hypothetical protein